MKILFLGRTGEVLTGAGTYQANLLCELSKRHEVKVYETEDDLNEVWDLAHCPDFKYLDPKIAENLKCPLVVDSHDYYWIRYFHFFCLDFPVRFLLQKYRKFKYGRMFKDIDAIVLHGRFVYDMFDHPNKFMNFYYGLDYSEITTKPWDEKENLILFVGSDYFRKGLPRLLRALPKVTAKVDDAKLIVIGNDYWYVKLFSRLLAIGLPVEFIYGMGRNELYRTYARAKVFVMPSEIEAIPLVSSEALMAGVPPILSDAGGNPEIVKDGETGFIVSLNDYGRLAEKIVICLTNGNISERLVTNGRKFLKQFTTEKMMDRIDEIYKDVLKRREDGIG